jgi:preprotein translocase subunit YajC
MRFDQLPAFLAQEGPAPSPSTDGQTSQGQGTAQQQQPPGTQPQGQGQGGGGGFSIIWILAIVLVGMWLFMITSQRKEKKKKQQMQQSLKKGAKVQTIGGVLGTVMEVREDEVIVKVDENANTRMRFARSAIQSVTSPEEESGEKES